MTCYSRHATDIVGYTYRADNLCQCCTIRALVRDGLAAPAAIDMAAEEVLDQIAEANAIDRQDERSYDSDDFPKVIFDSQLLEDERCGVCDLEM